MGLRNSVVRKPAIPDLTTSVLTLTTAELVYCRVGRRLMRISFAF